MNLYNLTNLIKDICSAQPNVNQVEVGDVYAINHKQDVEYPAMVVTQQTSFVDNINKATTYNFTIFYIDLLDSDESNMLDVQSIATVALNDVMDAIEGAGLMLAETYEQNTFKERFNDLCAGAFVRVGIIVDNETCGGEGYSLVYSVNGKSGDVWIDFPDVSDYYTKGETDELIDEKIESAVTSGIDLDNYWTSAQTEQAITQATSGKTSREYVDSEIQSIWNWVDPMNGELQELQAAMDDKADNSDVVHKSGDETIGGNKTFSGVVTLLGEEAVIIGNESLEDLMLDKLDVTAYTPTDLSEYWTSAQTQSAISSSVSDTITNVSFNGSAATVVNRVASITANVGEDNVIETVKVNGSALTVTNKAVDIAMPRFEVNNGILNIITQ